MMATAHAAAPTISGTPPTTGYVGTLYSFTPTARDTDGDPLTFTIYNRPSWATFSSTTGRLSGTPTSSHVGTYPTISIRVSDGATTVLLQAFTITVHASANNIAPTISGTPPTSVTAGNAYSFTPTASDANGDRLTFSIYNKPSWAAFSTTTGRLSGTPTASNVGSYPTISIRVSDGRAMKILPAFTLTVLASANRAPTISGTPSTSVVAGSAYSFRPTASDPDGNTLTFSIQNRPIWASFNATTGQLSGTPAATNVGDYSNIRITVSDGQASVSLPMFTIAVRQVSMGRATVSWTAPTTNTDGSALTNLAGFKILYGTSSANLNNQVQIASASATVHTVENLVPGTYYFAVRAYNSSGTDSDLSNVSSKVVQ